MVFRSLHNASNVRVLGAGSQLSTSFDRKGLDFALFLFFLPTWHKHLDSILSFWLHRNVLFVLSNKNQAGAIVTDLIGRLAGGKPELVRRGRDDHAEAADLEHLNHLHLYEIHGDHIGNIYRRRVASGLMRSLLHF